MRAAGDSRRLRIREGFRHQQPVQPVDRAEDDRAVGPVAFLQHAIVGVARGDQPLGKIGVRALAAPRQAGTMRGALAGISSYSQVER